MSCPGEELGGSGSPLRRQGTAGQEQVSPCGEQGDWSVWAPRIPEDQRGSSVGHLEDQPDGHHYPESPTRKMSWAGPEKQTRRARENQVKAGGGMGWGWGSDFKGALLSCDGCAEWAWPVGS